MLKRISCCLTALEGSFVRTRNFRADHIYASFHLDKKWFDEIIVLNIEKKRKQNEFTQFLGTILQDCFLPVTVGGGISKLDHVKKNFDLGVDRVSLNSLLWDNPKEVAKICQKYGTQAVVASLDLVKAEDEYGFYIWKTGKVSLSPPPILSQSQPFFGEILIQLVDRDGTVEGFDKKAFDWFVKKYNPLVPLHCSSGFARWDQYAEILACPQVDCVSVSNVHHMGKIGIRNLKAACVQNNIHVRIDP